MVLLCQQQNIIPWVPHFLKRNNDVNNNAEECIRIVRGVLNKLTTKKFDMLLQDLKEMDIWDDRDAFEEMVSVIFEQATQGPLFVHLYANLCADIRECEKDLHKMEAWFHPALLRKLQSSFEEILENLASGNLDYLSMMKEKRDMIGLLRFVAQLYRVKLVSFKIIEYCFVLFIRSFEAIKEDALLECVLRLLILVGPFVLNVLETGKINGYSSYLEKYKHEVCKRIKFIFDDLGALRERNWIIKA